MKHIDRFEFRLTVNGQRDWYTVDNGSLALGEGCARFAAHGNIHRDSIEAGLLRVVMRRIEDTGELVIRIDPRDPSYGLTTIKPDPNSPILIRTVFSND